MTRHRRIEFRFVARIALALAFIVLGTRDSAAGGEMVDAIEPRVASAEAVWRRQGENAIPAMIRALCSNDIALSRGAVETLIEVGGAPAVAPLIEVSASSRSCNSYDVEETIAGILCSAPESAGRAHRRLRTAVTPVNAALRRLTGPRKELVLAAIVEVTQRAQCENRAAVLQATAPSALKLLDVAEGDEKAETMVLLAFYGAFAAPALDKVTAMLDDPKLVANAAMLIGAVGPLAAPVVPRLRAMLAGPYASAAAMALGGIGEPARVALPDLIRRLGQAEGSDCKTAPALTEAIGDLRGVWESANGAQALASALRACSLDEETAITALGKLGQSAAPALPALVALLRDDSRTIFRRSQIAGLVTAMRAPLSPDDRNLIGAVEKKHDLQNRGRGDSGGQGGGPRVYRALPTPTLLDQTRNEIGICGAEVERQATRVLGGLPGLDTSKLEVMRSCVQNRLCGPGVDQYVATLRTCCQRSFGGAPPDWCSGSAM